VPKCNAVAAGGNNNDHDLTVTIGPDGQSAVWLCFRASCGFKGGVNVGNAAPATKLRTGAAAPAGVASCALHLRLRCLSLHIRPAVER
jgi:hypothetical protein